MSEPTGTQAPAPDGGQSGRPTPGERGLGGASAPPGRTDSPPAHQAPATGPRNSGWWAEGLSDYLNSGERPSHKVVLSYILGAGRTGDLAGFARALIERPHPELGNHLNFTFIVLQADGGKEMARLVAKLFEKQGVLIVAIPHALGGPGVPGAEVAQSVGLSGVITAEGRTLVMIGEEPFFVAGTPPPPRTRSSSVLFIYKARQTKKMYRLDYGLIPKGPSAGQTGWHHNQKGVLKILKLEGTDHTPASGWAKVAGWTCRIFKWAGAGLFLVGTAGDVVTIYYALDRGRAVSRVAGRVAGAALLAPQGARLGGRLGARGGVPGVVAGVVVGALLLGWFGAKLGEAVADWGYCRLFIPLEAEEWYALEETEVVAGSPVPAGK